MSLVFRMACMPRANQHQARHPHVQHQSDAMAAPPAATAAAAAAALPPPPAAAHVKATRGLLLGRLISSTLERVVPHLPPAEAASVLKDLGRAVEELEVGQKALEAEAAALRAQAQAAAAAATGKNGSPVKVAAAPPPAAAVSPPRQNQQQEQQEEEPPSSASPLSSDTTLPATTTTAMGQDAAAALQAHVAQDQNGAAKQARLLNK